MADSASVYRKRGSRICREERGEPREKTCDEKADGEVCRRQTRDKENRRDRKTRGKENRRNGKTRDEKADGEKSGEKRRNLKPYFRGGAP